MIPPMIRLMIVFAICGSLLAACNLQHAPAAESPALADADRPAQATETTVPAPPKAEPTSQPTLVQAAPEPTTDRCYAEADRSTRRISADVAVDYGAKTAAISQRIEFLNREDAALDHIVLDVQANQWEDSFSLETLAVNGQAAPYEINLNRLQVDLAEPLAPGCWLEISLRFQLRMYRDPRRPALVSWLLWLQSAPIKSGALPADRRRAPGRWLAHPRARGHRRADRQWRG